MTDRLLTASADFKNLLGLSNGIKPRTIGFLGESNALQAGTLGYSSWMFWALALKPRHIIYDAIKHNLGVGNAWSGPLYNSSTGAITNSTGSAVVDMNTATKRAQAVAAGVDDWFLCPNGNDTGTEAYSSYRNNREMVDYLRSQGAGKRFIFWSCILPKGGAQSFTAQLHAYMRAWAASTDDVFFVDLAHLLQDDTTAYGQASNGAKYAMFNDSIGHVAPAGAYIIGKYMNDYLDLIGGFPAGNIRNTNTLDVWSATNTGANVFNPSFFGANPGGAYIGANASGVTAPGSQIYTDSAELAVAGSIVSTTIRGRPHNALRLTFNAAATLTATRKATCTISNNLGVTINSSKFTQSMHHFQLAVKANALVDAMGIEAQCTGWAGMGAGGWLWPVMPALTEELIFRSYGPMDLTASTAIAAKFVVAFPTGVAAGALGSVDLALPGLWGTPVLPNNF